MLKTPQNICATSVMTMTSDKELTLTNTEVAGLYNSDWKKLMGPRASWLWSLLESSKGLSDTACAIVVQLSRPALTLKRAVAAERNATKLLCGSNAGLPSGEKFYTAAFDYVATRSPVAIAAEPVRVTSTRAEAAEVMADLFGSYVLADISRDWRGSLYGTGFDQCLMTSIFNMLTLCTNDTEGVP